MTVPCGALCLTETSQELFIPQDIICLNDSCILSHNKNIPKVVSSNFEYLTTCADFKVIMNQPLINQLLSLSNAVLTKQLLPSYLEVLVKSLENIFAFLLQLGHRQPSRAGQPVDFDITRSITLTLLVLFSLSTVIFQHK